MSTTAPSPSPTLHLTDLPPLPLLHILNNLLLSRTPIQNPSTSPTAPYVSPQPSLHPSILHVNRHLHTLGLPILYSQNKFRFITGRLFRNWAAETVTFPSRKLLTDLILHVSIKGIVQDFPGIDGRWTLLPLTEGNFPLLERLTLVFQEPRLLDVDGKRKLLQRIGSVDFKRGLKELRLIGLEPELKRLVMEELRDLTT